MTVAQHLWKAQMQFRYDSDSAVSYRKAQVHTQVSQKTEPLPDEWYWCGVKGAQTLVWLSLSPQNCQPSESNIWGALYLQVATVMFKVMLKLCCMQVRPHSASFVHSSPSFLPYLIYNWLLPLYQLNLLPVNNEWDTERRCFFPLCWFDTWLAVYSLSVKKFPTKAKTICCQESHSASGAKTIKRLQCGECKLIQQTASAKTNRNTKFATFYNLTEM